jgi:hypothetical protein
MEAVILSKEQFNNLASSIEEIKTKITAENKKPSENYLDNQEFLLLMKISKRTAQTWRDEGQNFIFSSWQQNLLQVVGCRRITSKTLHQSI